MKKLLWLLLILVGFSYAQYNPVYQFPNQSTGLWDENWVDSLNAYAWHSIGNDTTITSGLFAPQSGFDGLRQFLVRIDSLGDSRDGDSLIVVSNRLLSDESYRQKYVVIDTTSAFNISFVYQTWLDETFGWVTNDTLEWSLYSDTTRVDTITVLTLAHEAALYTSQFRPTESDWMREHGIWQTDVPSPWRVVGYFNHVQSGDTNTVLLKFEKADHVPNK